jgi:hypothetical protein
VNSASGATLSTLGRALLDKSLVLAMRGEMHLAIESASQAFALDPDHELVAEGLRL